MKTFFGRDNSLGSCMQRGFSLLESVVVLIIVLVVLGLMMNRFTYYQEQAEKTAMETMVGTLQSALTMQYSQILTRGKASDSIVLAQSNPINWLQQPPKNYAGELYDLSPLTVEPGKWVFDLRSHDLVYVPRNKKYLKPGKDGLKWIRFHVVVSHDTSLLPSLQGEPAPLTGVLLEPVEPYTWF